MGIQEFNRQMKSYFYELAVCNEADFNIFICALENVNFKPKAKKYIKTFVKYVKEARIAEVKKRKSANQADRLAALAEKYNTFI